MLNKHLLVSFTSFLWRGLKRNFRKLFSLHPQPTPARLCLLTQSNRSFTSSKWRNFKSSQATIHNHSITSCSHDMMKLNKMYAHHTSYLSRQLHKDIQTCPEVIVIPFSSTRPNEGIEEKCVCHIDWDLLLILFDLFTRQLKPPK